MAVAWTDHEPENKSKTMFHSNLEDIKSRFAVLLRSVQLALEANHVTTEDVYAVLVGMLSCGDHIVLPKTNLEDIFSAVTSHGLWSYSHHSPVEKLLRRFLPDHVCLIREYKAHLSGFYTTTKLIDYIQYTNIDSTEGDNELLLKDFTKKQYRKLMIKLNLERNINSLSLKYVQDLWEQFAEEFNIPFLTAVIDSILVGSLVIIWLVPPDVAERIIASACESIPFFQKHSITYAAVSDKQLFEAMLERCRRDLKLKLEGAIRQYCQQRERSQHVDINDEVLLNLIEKNININYESKSSYEVTAKSDAVITVTILGTPGIRIPRRQLLQRGGYPRICRSSPMMGGLGLTSMLIGALFGRAMIDDEPDAQNQGIDIPVPLNAVLRQLGRVREENRTCTVKLKLSPES